MHEKPIYRRELPKKGERAWTICGCTLCIPEQRHLNYTYYNDDIGYLILLRTLNSKLRMPD